jgi:PmbA protein
MAAIAAADPASDLAFAHDIVAKARAAGADAAQATLAANEQLEVGFDTRRLSLLRKTSDDTTALTVFRGGRKGAATLTGRAPEAVAQAVAEAMAACEAAPADPANTIAEGVPGAPSVHGLAAPDRELLVDRALEHIELLRREYPAIVARESYHRFRRTRRSFANSAGLARQETKGRYSFTTLFAAQRDGRTTSLNYSHASSYRPFARLADAAALRRLYDESSRSFDVEPVHGKFVGDLVIAPDALEGFLLWPLARVLGGYSLMAGTSPYREKKGQPIASPLFTLVNRPTAASFPEGEDFDGFGVPTRDLDVIRGGVLANFLVDFYISKKLGLEQTAGATAFVVEPGGKSEAEIIAETPRGILITRFSGGMPNDNLDFSGIAKNSFLIEDGRIKHPLAETMISGNLRELLLDIRAVSRETVDFGSARLPTVAAGGVTIHGRG